MRTFANIAAQGELRFTKLSARPKVKGKFVEPVNGTLIVGHSETGHHHVIAAECATLERIDGFTALLNVIKPCALQHFREHDTHEAISFEPGLYEVRTGREFDPFASTIRASAD